MVLLRASTLAGSTFLPERLMEINPIWALVRTHPCCGITRVFRLQSVLELRADPQRGCWPCESAVYARLRAILALAASGPLVAQDIADRRSQRVNSFRCPLSAIDRPETC
jgi:hypothetical protein